MKSFVSRAIGTLLLFSSFTSVKAAVIEQTQFLNFGTIGLFVDSSTFQQNLTDATFSKFDPSLGTINAATVTFVGFDVSYEGVFTAGAEDSSGEVLSRASLWYPAEPSLTGVTYQGGYGIDNTPAGQQTQFFFIDTFGSGPFALSNVLPFSVWGSGPGEFTIAAGLITQFISQSPGDASGQVSSYGNFGVLVTYDYTPNTAPVPVPAAAWLFGSAAVSLLALRRRATERASGRA